MYKGKKVRRIMLWGTSWLAAVALACVFITVRQLPDELTVQDAGCARLSTLLPVSVEYTADGNGSAKARLFGTVGVKNVIIHRERPGKVLLAGTLFGLRLYSDGVMVVGLSDFGCRGENVNPARKAGIREGDLIRTADGKPVYTNADFAKAVKNSHGSMTLEITDGEGKTKKVSLTPKVSDADGGLKTGMWVRDSAAGIGTLTYIDPESGSFGGLGHGICDSDTHSIVPVLEGDIVGAQLTSLRRGVRGMAGEIRGCLGSDKLGELTDNTQSGAFGRYTADFSDLREYEVAFKQEVRPGKAKILCTVEPDSIPKMYDIVIEKINYSGEPTKNMIVSVTDERLLELTGGIIQGMSGSPVIQNGKFVGAVTHVFVNNPKCGYAIFAENMTARQPVA